MTNIIEQEEELNVFDSPFTELFSLLKQYERPFSGPVLAYKSQDLMIISQLVDHVLGILLQGLHGVGYLIGTLSLDTKFIEAINQVGFFITTIINLADALNELKVDAVYALKEPNVMNY